MALGLGTKLYSGLLSLAEATSIHAGVEEDINRFGEARMHGIHDHSLKLGTIRKTEDSGQPAQRFVLTKKLLQLLTEEHIPRNGKNVKPALYYVVISSTRRLVRV